MGSLAVSFSGGGPDRASAANAFRVHSEPRNASSGCSVVYFRLNSIVKIEVNMNVLGTVRLRIVRLIIDVINVQIKIKKR